MNLILLAPVGSILALCFAGYLAFSIMKKSEGTDEMIKIASAIRKGANAYLKRQYTGVAIFFAVMVAILTALAIAGFLTPFVPFAFLTGGLFSGLSGFLGMKIATAANSRTANAQDPASTAGFAWPSTAVPLWDWLLWDLVCDLSIWYFFLDWFYGTDPIRSKDHQAPCSPLVWVRAPWLFARGRWYLH